MPAPASPRRFALCLIGTLSLILLASGITRAREKPSTTSPGKKIASDLKTTLSYEFAIPNAARCRAEVKRIDPSVRFMPGSSGRIGAKKGECLCIGNTYKNGRRRTTLYRLAALPYIKRIIPCYFE